MVGISDYQFSPRLTNPRNDAAGVSTALKDAGFDVVSSLDPDMAGLLRTLEAFYSKAVGSDAALFYFAGHGLQYDGTNYLVPRDAQLRSDTRLKQETVALQDIISAIEKRSKIALIFLDACRDNPLADELQRTAVGKNRSATVPRGLARMDINNPNTLVVFATAPGRTASDGKGRNSPFTEAVLKHMAEPGVEIEQMLKRVTLDVHQATRGEQIPARLSQLTSMFVFKPSPTNDWNTVLKPVGAPPEIPLPPRPSATDQCAVEDPVVSCLWRKQ